MPQVHFEPRGLGSLRIDADPIGCEN
jgi:hypothetical protein